MGSGSAGSNREAAAASVPVAAARRVQAAGRTETRAAACAGAGVGTSAGPRAGARSGARSGARALASAGSPARQLTLCTNIAHSLERSFPPYPTPLMPCPGTGVAGAVSEDLCTRQGAENCRCTTTTGSMRRGPAHVCMTTGTYAWTPRT